MSTPVESDLELTIKEWWRVVSVTQTSSLPAVISPITSSLLSSVSGVDGGQLADRTGHEGAGYVVKAGAKAGRL